MHNTLMALHITFPNFSLVIIYSSDIYLLNPSLYLPLIEHNTCVQCYSILPLHTPGVIQLTSYPRVKFIIRVSNLTFIYQLAHPFCYFTNQTYTKICNIQHDVFLNTFSRLTPLWAKLITAANLKKLFLIRNVSFANNLSYLTTSYAFHFYLISFKINNHQPPTKLSQHYSLIQRIYLSLHSSTSRHNKPNSIPTGTCQLPHKISTSLTYKP